MKAVSDAHGKYSKVDVIKMLKFLNDNIYVELNGQIFSQQLAFQWAQTAPPYLPTHFFTGIRRRLYKGS